MLSCDFNRRSGRGILIRRIQSLFHERTVETTAGTANLTGMAFLPAYVEHGVRMLSDDEVGASVERVIAHVVNPEWAL